MCAPVLVVAATATAAAAGGMQAYGQQQAGKAQSKMYQYQASLAQQQAAREREYAKEQQKNIESAAEQNITATQGEAAEQSKRLAREVSVLAGTQKAMMGALGIGGTTAEDIIGSTFDRARMDEMAIRYNANVRSWQIGQEAKRNIWTLGEETKSKSWALEAEAVQYGAAAKNAKRVANIETTATLLKTASQTAGMGASIAKPKKVTV